MYLQLRSLNALQVHLTAELGVGHRLWCLNIKFLVVTMTVKCSRRQHCQVHNNYKYIFLSKTEKNRKKIGVKHDQLNFAKAANAVEKANSHLLIGIRKNA